MGPVDATIFGEHEPRGGRQLAPCVAEEEDSRGVLCADGSPPLGS